MRTKNTIKLLGLWEKLNNSDFKQVEFDLFKNEIVRTQMKSLMTNTMIKKLKI